MGKVFWIVQEDLILRVLLRWEEWGQSQREVNIMVKAEGKNTTVYV